MRRPLLAAAAVAALLAVAVGGCGGDDDAVGAGRATQVRQAALDAGLDTAVADVLALAAHGATATFQVTYAGSDGAALVVSQQPPNRRVDVVTAGLIVESQLVRDGVGYLCALPDQGRPGDELECTRRQGALTGQGAFTESALDQFTDELAGALDAVDLTVETRTIAEVEATCLITAPKAGTVLDEAAPGVDTLCLAPDGAQLLVDAAGERVVAESYSPTVPTGTFDLPARPDS